MLSSWEETQTTASFHCSLWHNVKRKPKFQEMFYQIIKSIFNHTQEEFEREESSKAN